MTVNDKLGGMKKW